MLSKAIGTVRSQPGAYRMVLSCSIDTSEKQHCDTIMCVNHLRHCSRPYVTFHQYEGGREAVNARSSWLFGRKPNYRLNTRAQTATTMVDEVTNYGIRTLRKSGRYETDQDALFLHIRDESG